MPSSIDFLDLGDIIDWDDLIRASEMIVHPVHLNWTLDFNSPLDKDILEYKAILLASVQGIWSEIPQPLLLNVQMNPQFPLTA